MPHCTLSLHYSLQENALLINTQWFLSVRLWLSRTFPEIFSQTQFKEAVLSLTHCLFDLSSRMTNSKILSSPKLKLYNSRSLVRLVHHYGPKVSATHGAGNEVFANIDVKPAPYKTAIGTLLGGREQEWRRLNYSPTLVTEQLEEGYSSVWRGRRG